MATARPVKFKLRHYQLPSPVDFSLFFRHHLCFHPHTRALARRKRLVLANPKHLQMLEKGVVAWNQWRDKNSFLHPDLSNANLGNANLSRANLTHADLSLANLSRAYLSEATLSQATLSEANLSRATLRQANLSEATLLYANLSQANLSGADLSRADLSEAWIVYTMFADIDLSQAVGLETVKHRGPSTLGIDTVYRSQGKIPEIFLRGAGVPDNFIAYMPSLMWTGFQYYSCFISYSSQDQEFADRLYADLQAKGVRCWLATEDLKIGDKFRQRIDDAIRLHDKLLLVLSETSVRSTWVESEVETAFEKERASQEKRLVLFPIRLDDAVMDASQAWAGDIRRMRQIGDFRAWRDHNSYQEALARLLRDLRGKQAAEAAG